MMTWKDVNMVPMEVHLVHTRLNTFKCLSFVFEPSILRAVSGASQSFSWPGSPLPQ